jgi:hypothetical protein
MAVHKQPMLDDLELEWKKYDFDAFNFLLSL